VADKIKATVSLLSKLHCYQNLIHQTFHARALSAYAEPTFIYIHKMWFSAVCWMRFRTRLYVKIKNEQWRQSVLWLNEDLQTLIWCRSAEPDVVFTPQVSLKRIIRSTW